MTIVALAVLGGAGGALAGLSPDSAAVAVGCVVAVSAGVLLAAESSLGILAETLAAFLGAGLVTGAPAGFLLGYSFGFVGLWATGMTRRAYVLRAEQAELMLAETRRAREAETHAAALAERARIARDIHDVLAHSLAAVSVNLQAAAGLLGSETLPADNPELARAIECVGRAAALTKEGLAAARRAVLALRDEAAPLPDQLSSLAGEYAAAGDAPVEFAVTGEMRPVSAEAGLAAYRTAQEALTNARKHAPGQPVTLRLGFEPGQLTVAVVNRLPDGPPRRAARRVGRRLRPGRPAGAGGAGRRLAGGGPAGRKLAGLAEDPGVSDEGGPVTVVVADDQSAVREGLVLLLGTLPGISVVGQAGDGEAAVALAAAARPQVVLMDLNMPRCDGVEATRRIRAGHPDTRVVVLTTYSDDESIIAALQAGALGYLTKDATRAEIGRAVHAAAAGQAVLAPEVQQRLLAAATRAGAPAAPDDERDHTPRESQVLALIAAGRSNREIARALVVSEATVKTHVNRIFAKTGSRDRAQATRYAYTHGYAEP